MPKTTSLRFQILILSVGLLTVGVGGLVVWAGYHVQQASVDRSYQELVANALVLATVLHEPIEHGQVAESVLAEYARSVKARIVVLDHHLRPIASSERGAVEANWIPRRGWGREGSELRLYATVPVLEDGRPKGALELSVPAAVVLEPVRRSWLALAAAGVALVATVGTVSALLAGWITRPLHSLTGAVEDVASGNLSRRVPLDGPEEFRRLATSFNRMAQQVQAMVERQRVFAAHAAHELRSPLASLKVRLEMLEGKAEEAGIRKLAQEALRAADRLQRLVDHLLALQAVQEGGAPRRQPVDLAPVLYELADEVGPLASQSGLCLQVDVPAHLPEVTADVEHVRWIVRNLLDNAIRHTPEGGRVVLRAGPAQHGVEVAVQDTGVGIAPEHLPHVFDRFYRVPTHLRGPEGSGLGLALVRELVEAHGGRVEVSSEPGLGSTFRVWLPGAKSLPDAHTRPPSRR